jgi:ABC-type glycerol-3-phosphate transport system substrate-binding protein
MKKYLLFLLLILFVLFLFSGCLNSDGQTIILWTDQPEMAAYIEQFNAENQDFRIELEFSESPKQAVTNSITLPDLVIGKYLTNYQAIEIFSPLDNLFQKERLSRKRETGPPSNRLQSADSDVQIREDRN